MGCRRTESEQSVLHLLEVETGRLLDDRIPRTRAASLAWLPDNSGFYYTRYPAPADVPGGEEHYHRSIYFHRWAPTARRPAGVPPAGKGILARRRLLAGWALAADSGGPHLR